MTWIKIIEYDQAKGRLLKLYDQCKNPDGTIDNVLKIHSLRPSTLLGHLHLYKAALHTRPSELSYRERELVGTYTSHLNGCKYCVAHHKTGLGRELGDQDEADNLLNAAVHGDETILTERDVAMLGYAKKLTLHPQEMVEDDLAPLRAVGLGDAGILDVNQIVAYFCYVNRMVNGLGVDIGDEVLGLHPSDETEGFEHA